MVDKIDIDFNLDDEEEPNFDLEENFNNSKGGGLDDNDDLDEFTIRIFGLDNSGKSTLMMNLIEPKEGNVAEITEDFNADILIYKNSKINFWDISGKKDYRNYWKNYFHSSDAYCFVIDISNKNRFNEAKEALNSLILSDSDNEGTPILIYANKSDLTEEAIKPETVLSILGIESNTTNEFKVQVCSAKKLKGLEEGLEWLYSKLKVV